MTQDLPDPPNNRSAKRSLYIFGVSAVLGMAAFTAVMVRGRATQVADARQKLVAKAEQGIPILAAPVNTSEAVRTITLPGELRPLQNTTIYAKISGYLQKIAVDKGDHVKAQQILARIASQETDMQVRKLQSALHVAEQTEARHAALVADGTVSQQEMDTARAAREAAQASLQSELALQSYELIRAPFDGVVTARYTDGGMLLPAATSSTQSALPLLELQDTSIMRVMVYLGQHDAPFVHVGDAMHITCRDLPDLNIHTHVTRISEALDVHTRTMLVEVDLDNRSHGLRSGIYVQVQLSVNVPASLTVPIDAIFLRGGVTYVAVIEEGIARYTQVKTGTDDGRSVQILAGLKQGQHVGMHIGDAINDGAKVRIIEPHRSPIHQKE